MDRQTHKVDITYNIDRVEDVVALDKDHYVCDRVDYYLDRFNKYNGFAVINYEVTENNVNVPKQKMEFFFDKLSRDEFIRTTFYRDSYVHKIDGANINAYLYKNRVEKNYMDLEFNDYINGGTRRRKIRVPGIYNDFVKKLVEKLRENDPRSSLDVEEGYREIIVDEKKPKLEESKKEEVPRRQTRMEKRREREKNAFPMPKPKNKIRSLKIICGLTALAVTIGGIGYVVVRNAFKDKVIAFKQVKADIFNGRDNYIRDNMDKASETADKLLDKNYSELSREDIEHYFKFIDEVIMSDFDKGKSSTKILYDDYFSDKYRVLDDHTVGTIRGIDADEFLENIEGKYDACFARYSDGTNVLRDKYVNKYLNYVGSLSVMKNRYPGAWNNDVPNKDDSDKDYASTKDVSTFEKLDPSVRLLILKQYRAVLARADYKPEKTAYYFNTVLDKNTLLGKVDNEIAILKDYIRSLQKVNSEENKKNM